MVLFYLAFCTIIRPVSFYLSADAEVVIIFEGRGIVYSRHGVKQGSQHVGLNVCNLWKVAAERSQDVLDVLTGDPVEAISDIGGAVFRMADVQRRCPVHLDLNHKLNQLVSLPQLLVDYPFAFGALGLSGFFSEKKNGLVIGYLAAITGRFFFAVLSGVIFFGMYAPEEMSPLAYSIAYNGGYIYAEGILTVLILMIPAVKSALAAVKTQAKS